jgi:hypothetical protein
LEELVEVCALSARTHRGVLRHGVFLRAALSLMWSLGCMAVFCLPVQAIDIGTSAPFRQQKFEAWGTSLAWFGNALGNWSNTQAHAEVMDLLFDGPNHLGLNYARYNIGGGQNPLLVGNLRPGANVPGWAPLAPTSVSDATTWNWNWNADPGQRKSLDAAITRSVNRVDAVSYSAPYWMTTSYDTSGAVGGGDNLQTNLYDEYAHYQTEVIKHFRDERGIEFGTFAPMNEPDASWWQAGGGQEGMHVSQGFNQRLLIETVGQALTAKGLATGVSGSDEFSASTSVNAFNQYNATTLGYVKQLNTHVYGGAGSNSTASMQALRNLAKSRNIPLYQSEYGNNSSSGLSGGIDLANRITADLNVMGVNGWTFWQAVEPISLSGSGWGLLWADYNANGSGYVVRPQYHVMRQFTSFIRPGANILSTDDAETVAAYNSGSDTTALVFTNDETTPDVNVYNLLDKTPAYSRVVRTDGSGNFVSLGPASISGNQLTVNSPGTAVTTAVVYHRPNLIQNAGFAGGAAGWQMSGNAAHNASADNTHDGSGSVALQTNSAANAGAVWQEGIGSAKIDLTGKAYEFSADLLLQNSNLQFGANAHMALEFYGADGQTLTHESLLDFAEELKPFTQDSTYRVFRTAAAQAPTGARFVRPVVRFDNVAPGASALVYLDNAYLQETRYAPRARAWTADDNGVWNDDDNWQNDALVENNRAAYFGPNITRRRTITLDADVTTAGVTFDSEFGYDLAGESTLTIASDSGAAKVDVRSGNHAIQTPIVVGGPTQVQVVGVARLSLEGSFNLNGQRLEKIGPGQLRFTDGFEMAGGTLAIEASLAPGIAIGSDAVLDGILEVAMPVGQQATWGSLYTLASLTSPTQSFSEIVLPNLSRPWLDWDVQYQSSRLTAEVVNRADFNRDGRLDAADVAQWKGDFGVDAGSDADGNGITDGGDFLVWQRALGEEFATNTLALVVDPTTGDARLENFSAHDFTIDAYTISSESNSLLTSWSSLEDQNMTGWVEALPTSGRLSELNPSGALLLSVGSAIDLPGLFDVASGLRDLTFQFRDVDLGTVSGRVVYAPFGSPISEGVNVPEPTGSWLLLIFATFWRRRRQ